MAAIVSSRPHTPFQYPIHLPLKISFSDSNSKNKETNSNKTETDSGWSFLQALSNVSRFSEESTKKESAYVHPQVKQSSTKMTQKSLELCTEKLGNETGSDIVDENNGYDMDLLCSSSSPRREKQGGRKMRIQNFPPPLNTMRGFESLSVRSHREDGRLVVEAIRVPQSASCFQADRSDGRLRLCLLESHDNFVDPEETQVSDGNEGVEEEAKEDEKWKKQKKRAMMKKEKKKQRKVNK